MVFDWERFFEIMAWFFLSLLCVIFLIELFFHQAFLVTQWAYLSFEQRTLENINLGLMDLKFLFSFGLYLWWLQATRKVV